MSSGLQVLSGRTFRLSVMGGLVSRLRAVICAHQLCEIGGAKLVLYWPKYEPIYEERFGGFDAKFSDMWAKPRLEEVDRVEQSWPKALRWESSGDVYLRTCHIEPFLPWLRVAVGEWFLENFEASEAVSEIVGEHWAEVFHCTGVHIRYDIKDSRTVEPEWFIKRCRALGPRKYWLSCDHPEVERLFKEEFPETACLPRTYAYDKEGIIKAAADLYLLSDCEWVVGSNRSSYSQLVALMRGATYKGEHEYPGGLQGGFYEDAWNPAECEANT